MNNLKINWQVRLRNKTFWLTAGSGLLLVAKQVADLKGVTLPMEEMHGYLEAALALLVALGVVVDPTTAGVGDSVQAMGYKWPQH